MNTKEINVLVAKAYRALEPLNNIKHTAYRNVCFELACEEERGHRRGFGHDEYPDGATVSAAGRLFTVKRIAEALIGDRLLSVRDYINVQKSAFTAQSVVENFREEATAALEGFDLKELAGLDYCAFVGNK